MSFFKKLFSGSSGSSIGLDIGTSAIKAVEVSKSGDGFKINSLVYRPIPLGIIKDSGKTFDMAGVTAEIQAIVKEMGENVKRVISAVSGPHVIIRTINMPRMTGQELKNSIRYEAERYLPYPVAEAQIDGVILRDPSPDDEKNMEVLLMAAPKEVVQNIEEAIRKSNLQVEAIELEPTALLRLARSCVPAETLKQTVAFINIGATFTSINIFNSEHLRNSRTITTAGNAITKAIAQAMNLSFEEAEKLKIEKAMVRIEKDTAPVSPTTIRIFSIILPVLTELVTEIHRSFDFYRSRYRKESVDRIYLSGGTARLKNLDRYIAGELGIRVENFYPFSKFGKTGISGMSFEQLEELTPALAVVLGIALRDLA